MHQLWLNQLDQLDLCATVVEVGTTAWSACSRTQNATTVARRSHTEGVMRLFKKKIDETPRKEKKNLLEFWEPGSGDYTLNLTTCIPCQAKQVSS